MSLAASIMTLALSMPASLLHTVKAALALRTAASTSVAPQACSWQRTRPAIHSSRHNRIRDGNVYNQRTCCIEKNQCRGIARCDCDHVMWQSLIGQCLRGESFGNTLPVAGSYTGSDLAFTSLRLTRPPHQKLSGSLI